MARRLAEPLTQLDVRLARSGARNAAIALAEQQSLTLEHARTLRDLRRITRRTGMPAARNPEMPR